MNDKFRMYGLVPYNISPIQQAIQYGHALQEYNNMIKDNFPGYKISSEFDVWRKECKTFIILNGGTSTNIKGWDKGSMEQHLDLLNEHGIPVGTFYEPDLNFMLSGIVFLCPEQVYNKEEYPNFKEWVFENHGRQYKPVDNDWVSHGKISFPELYDEWVKFVGGQTNAFLKEFTSQFRLA